MDMGDQASEPNLNGVVERLFKLKIAYEDSTQRPEWIQSSNHDQEGKLHIELDADSLPLGKCKEIESSDVDTSREVDLDKSQSSETVAEAACDRDSSVNATIDTDNVNISIAQDHVTTQRNCKVFVGGVPCNTTDESFRELFSQFGTVLEAKVMRDTTTGVSRGYGFLTFKKPASAAASIKACATPAGLVLGSRRIQCKYALATVVGGQHVRKLFVGGLPRFVTSTNLHNHFKQYDAVVNAVVMIDRSTGVSRGFGFVTFAENETIEAVLSSRQTVGGKVVEVRKAISRQLMSKERGEVDQENEAPMQAGFYGMASSVPPGEFGGFSTEEPLFVVHRSQSWFPSADSPVRSSLYQPSWQPQQQPLQPLSSASNRMVTGPVSTLSVPPSCNSNSPLLNKNYSPLRNNQYSPQRYPLSLTNPTSPMSSFCHPQFPSNYFGGSFSLPFTQMEDGVYVNYPMQFPVSLGGHNVQGVR
eukprot:gb/GEZN01007192.1/.p1 GENE.gb/GEZN01007192.1/~~gb/GEZN01007192.1/.p1  ORF type:complete len:473 (-),score=58.71 gb/GEZN01007192.1/:100-1518(-)